MRIPVLALVLIPIAYGQTPNNCADLSKFKSPGLTITATKMESLCRVQGMIDKRTGAGGKTYGIGFELALPDNWNNRFLFQGGGGYNGVVRPPVGAAAAGDTPGIAQGFAVVSTDTGHQGSDKSFYADQQAGLDFAYAAVGRVAVISKQIVARYYGEPAKYSYFVGCSTGGREAMLMTQRYADYFDGVISGDPAIRTGFAEIGRAAAAAAFNQIGPGPIFSDSDKKLVVNGILNACDAKDGLKDGMIFNIQACKFDPGVLACSGAKNDGCLTSQQAAAIKKAFAGARDSKGKLVYPPSAYDTGISLPGMPSGSAPLENDVDARAAAVAADPMNALTDTTWTNLSSFSSHGGKLLFYHGMSDTGFSPLDTIDYYQRMSKANGGMDQVQNWSRLFLVPGMGHCRGGQATLDNFNLLSALVAWVEKGTAPDSVVAKGTSLPGRTRPLCAYPKYAFYKGQGDTEDAKNFECRE